MSTKRILAISLSLPLVTKICNSVCGFDYFGQQLLAKRDEAKGSKRKRTQFGVRLRPPGFTLSACDARERRRSRLALSGRSEIPVTAA